VPAGVGELLACFGDAGGAPAQRDVPALPVLHAARVVRAMEIIDSTLLLERSVRARVAPRRGGARSASRAGPHAARLPIPGGSSEFLGKGFELNSGGQCRVGVVSLAHPLDDRGGELVGAAGHLRF
jgi:hypothetical protein